MYVMMIRPGLCHQVPLKRLEETMLLKSFGINLLDDLHQQVTATPENDNQRNIVTISIWQIETMTKSSLPPPTPPIPKKRLMYKDDLHPKGEAMPTKKIRIRSPLCLHPTHHQWNNQESSTTMALNKFVRAKKKLKMEASYKKIDPTDNDRITVALFKIWNSRTITPV